MNDYVFCWIVLVGAVLLVGLAALAAATIWWTAQAIMSETSRRYLRWEVKNLLVICRACARRMAGLSLFWRGRSSGRAVKRRPKDDRVPRPFRGTRGRAHHHHQVVRGVCLLCGRRVQLEEAVWSPLDVLSRGELIALFADDEVEAEFYASPLALLFIDDEEHQIPEERAKVRSSRKRRAYEAKGPRSHASDSRRRRRESIRGRF